MSQKSTHHPFTGHAADTVAAIGESKLIDYIKRWLGPVNPPAPHGIGDDCAILPAATAHRQQVITVDPVIYQRHFNDRVAPRDVGAQLLKRNLSDLAAMGAAPTAAVIALSLSPSLRTEWLAQFYRGLAATARSYGVPIVGGDIAQAAATSSSPCFCASLTLLGQATGPRLLTRTGAQAGDWIYVTGRLGGSILGHHFKFKPRLAEGAWLAAQSPVVALMDLSDGLAKDLRSLTPANAIAHLNPATLPLSPAATRLARQTGQPALEHALTDGEDYELLFVLSASADHEAFEQRWGETFATPLSCIGYFATPETALPPSLIELGTRHGYAHLR